MEEYEPRFNEYCKTITNVQDAKAAYDAASVALTEAQDQIVDREEALKVAWERLRLANARLFDVNEITYEEVYENGIEGEFSYLNDDIQKVKDAEVALADAKAEIAPAEEAYQLAYEKFTKAQNAYILALADQSEAQAVYDSFVKQEGFCCEVFLFL